MDTNSNQLTTVDSSSSSPSSSSSSPIWDVFLSFYGKDTRTNFTAHLYTAFDQADICIYRDDPALEKGQEISSGLLKAIQDSKASIVVFSQNYARSSWCLDELAEILACCKTKGLMIFPVFYRVDPSDIRRQKGSFKEALEVHQTRYSVSVDKIDKWRAALSEIAGLNGYHIEKDSNTNESEIIQKILKDVAPRVSTKSLRLEEHLFGIDSAVKEIYTKLSMQSNDVRAIGIYGMGGIGKTTIAKAFYNKYFDKFDTSCFCEDVKQTLRGPHGLLSLLKQLLVQLRKKDFNVLNVESGITDLTKIFSSRRVLLVLDDFDESRELEFLVRHCNSLSPESRIIMTTRDTHLLSRLDVETYMVKKLGKRESFELFSYHAFRGTIPLPDFRKLSQGFVDYLDGVPLALEVVGSSLRKRTVSFWKDKLEQLKKIPENRIQEVLKMSYDELSNQTVKDIFLDIVFFFIGKDKDEAVNVFTSCDFYPNIGIPILEERCLLTIDEHNMFRMHNLILDMGKEIIRVESKMPGKSRRLLCQGNALESLKYQEGTSQIEGLILDLATWTQKKLSTKIFEVVPNLRLLEIHNTPRDFKANFENSFQELRCIRWHYCPWKCLPSSFRPQKLVSLDMQFSKFKTLWKGSMPLASLKSINVNRSVALNTTPNFSNVKMLEKLSLKYCQNLLKVQSSIGQLSKLSYLDFGGCPNLKELPDPIGELVRLSHLGLHDCHSLRRLPKSINQLTRLTHLNLIECRKLKRLPEQLGAIKGLKTFNASCTAIEQLPDSICQLTQLNIMNLAGCKKLRKLPEQIGDMEALKTFDASQSALEQLPDSFEGLVNLVELKLYHCKNLRALPNNVWKLSLLELLDVSNCLNLGRLPEQLGKMECLNRLDASYTAIEELPESIGQLIRLKELDLSGCKKLGNMPCSIWNLTLLEDLKLWQRDILENLPDSVQNMERLERLTLRCEIETCLNLIMFLPYLNDLTLTDVVDNLSLAKPFTLASNLPKVRAGSLFSPPYVEKLSIVGCISMGKIPQYLSYSFLYLRTLLIRKCNNLQSLPRLPLNLVWLEIDDCPSLQDLPDLSTLKKLEDLRITNCPILKFNVEENFFQVLSSNNFQALVPTREIPNYFSYRASGSKLSFDVPLTYSTNNFIGIALWIVYRCKSCKSFIRATITNKTKGTKHNHTLNDLYVSGVGSVITRLYRDQKLMKYSSEDRIEISFELVMESPPNFVKVSDSDGKVESCGMHLIYKPVSNIPPSTTSSVHSTNRFNFLYTR